MTTTTTNTLTMESKPAPEITMYQWNGSTLYQIDGKGETFMTYGLADRALRQAANN